MYILSKECWSENRKFTVPEQIALGTFLGSLFALFAVSIHLFGAQAFARVDQFFGHFTLRYLMGMLVLLLGVSAALFKQRNQALYGFVEFMFGVVSGFAVSFGMLPGKTTPSQWASLVACGYVIARGIGNSMEAAKAAKLAPALAPFPIPESQTSIPTRLTEDSELDE